MNLDNDNDSSSSSNSQFNNNSFTTPPMPTLATTATAAASAQPMSATLSNNVLTTAQILNNSKLSPLQQIQQVPPPLPPLLPAQTPTTTMNATTHHQQQQQQHPPPLPPLPPALASKYSLSVKTYQLDTNNANADNTVSNSLTKQPQPQSQPPCDATTTGTPVASLNNAVNNNFESLESSAKIDRRIKGMSTCSDLDNYFKDFINEPAPQVDTNSESMSGGELSGDTFASPSLNTADSVASLHLAPYDTAVNAASLTSSLLMQSASEQAVSTTKANPNASTNAANTAHNSNTSGLSNNINESLNSSLFSGNTTETGASSISNMSTSGLLLIESRNNDERSASFIDSKCNSSH